MSSARPSVLRTCSTRNFHSNCCDNQLVVDWWCCWFVRKWLFVYLRNRRRVNGIWVCHATSDYVCGPLLHYSFKSSLFLAAHILSKWGAADCWYDSLGNVHAVGWSLGLCAVRWFWYTNVLIRSVPWCISPLRTWWSHGLQQHKYQSCLYSTFLSRSIQEWWASASANNRTKYACVSIFTLAYPVCRLEQNESVQGGT